MLLLSCSVLCYTLHVLLNEYYEYYVILIKLFSLLYSAEQDKTEWKPMITLYLHVDVFCMLHDQVCPCTCIHIHTI